MEAHELKDAGFTEGYSHAIDGKPRRLGAPMELVLLVPDRLVYWRNGYEEGFAKGKADHRALIEWRQAQVVAMRDKEGTDRSRDE